MKTQRIKKKLSLRKITISRLDRVEAQEIRGRALCLSTWFVHGYRRKCSGNTTYGSV
ncbi:MAG: hypothetical protein GY765_28855 [bacterium]|nr:hypothetical protein [bacterium]